ncbi:MAG: LPS assembly lipoprotein LptE [Rhodoferax sp.]
MVVLRRLFLAATVSALAGCGFKLRSSQDFVFQTLAVTPEKNGLVAADLIRYFDKAIVPITPPKGGQPPQVIVDVLQENREKIVVGVNSSGQVREFQLRIRLQFRVRVPDGREIIAPTWVVQQRDISFNESAVLAKEAEETLLFRDMQADLLQQLLRRLAAIKSLD